MVRGVVCLDGEDIGIFEIFIGGHVRMGFTKVANTLEDVLEFASDNGMTLSLSLRPEFDEYVPAHKQDLPSPM